jgi:four helix bundle protein
MEFKFEKLEVWHLALSVIPVVYALLDKYPKKEQFNLVAQGRRSIISVALNIAEGNMRQSRKEYAQFVGIAIGSLVETIANLKIAMRLGYTHPGEYDAVSPLLEKLYFKLLALRKSLRTEGPQ